MLASGFTILYCLVKFLITFGLIFGLGIGASISECGKGHLWAAHGVVGGVLFLSVFTDLFAYLIVMRSKDLRENFWGDLKDGNYFFKTF